MLRFKPSVCVRKFLTFSVLCFVPVIMHADTIFSENFDELTPALGVTSAGAFSAIDGTNIDILGGALYGFECLAPASGNCIDLGGSGGDPLGDFVSALISIPSAGTYFLSFDLIGNSINANNTSATVTLGGSTDPTMPPGAPILYQQSFTLTPQDTVDGVVSGALITVTTPGTYSLEFLNTTAGSDINDGPILDNVLLANATPEPATGLLLGSALLAASLIRKRAVR